MSLKVAKERTQAAAETAVAGAGAAAAAAAVVEIVVEISGRKSSENLRQGESGF